LYPNWGATIDRSYQADFANGANLLTITGGHTIDALCYCLREFRELATFVEPIFRWNLRPRATNNTWLSNYDAELSRISSPTAQTSQRPPLGDREFADSPVEQAGFELAVPP
jgi:hypothetical protein